MANLLIGHNVSTSTSTDFNAAGVTSVWRHAALVSGNLAVIKAQTQQANATATAIRLGIYDEVGGLPKNLLGVASVDGGDVNGQGSALFQATLATPVALVQGTFYWIGWHASTEQWDWKGDIVNGCYRETIGAEDFLNPIGGVNTGNKMPIIYGEDNITQGGLVGWYKSS